MQPLPSNLDQQSMSTAAAAQIPPLDFEFDPNLPLDVEFDLNLGLDGLLSYGTGKAAGGGGLSSGVPDLTGAYFGHQHDTGTM